MPFDIISNSKCPLSLCSYIKSSPKCPLSLYQFYSALEQIHVSQQFVIPFENISDEISVYHERGKDEIHDEYYHLKSLSLSNKISSEKIL